MLKGRGERAAKRQLREQMHKPLWALMLSFAAFHDADETTAELDAAIPTLEEARVDSRRSQSLNTFSSWWRDEYPLITELGQHDHEKISRLRDSVGRLVFRAGD